MWQGGEWWGRVAAVVVSACFCRMSQGEESGKKDGKEVCKECKIVVDGKEKGVECDGCEHWFHEKCAGISSALYTAMSKYKSTKGAALYWFCGGCNVGYRKFRGEVQELRLAQEKMNDKMDEIGSKVSNEVEECRKVGEKNRKDLEEIMTWGLDKKIVENVRKDIEEVRVEGQNVKKSFADIVKEEMEACKASSVGKDKANERKLRMEILEMQERSKRRDKLILMGVPEEGAGGEGTEIIHDVIEGLLPGVAVEYKVVGRIGLKGQKPRPVRILVEDPGHRRRLLSKARGLRELESFKRIFIVPDLTRMQQEEDKKLRDELRAARQPGFRARIHKGEVIKEVIEKVENVARGEVSGVVSAGINCSN